MSMKTFFTIVAFLFLGIVVAILIAGYISHDNRVTKEAYTKQTETQLSQLNASVSETQKKLDLIEAKFNEVGSSTKTSSQKTTTTKKVTTTKPVTTAPAQSGTVLSASLVATHSKETSCWIIVSGKVYSVASYIASHPGGRSVILNQCGKDATTVFTTRGGTGSHSSSAWSLLGGYLVGSLGATVKL